MSKPTDPRDSAYPNDDVLKEEGWAAGADVWGPVTKIYTNLLGDPELANAQLWSLRQAILEGRD